jgi:hypothetical protein
MIGIIEQNKFFAPISPQIDVLTNAVALYNFEDTTDTLTDEINGYNGVNSGALKEQTGKVGNAWKYDTSSDNVIVNSNSVFSAVDNGNNVDFAFAGWFQRTGEVATTRVLMARRNTSSNTDSEWMFWHSTNWLFRYWFADGTYLEISHASSFDLNTWYHVGVAIDLADTSKPLKMYLNGVDVNGSITGTIDSKVFNASSSDLRLCGLNYATLPMIGLQDQTIFWKNRQITPDIFSHLYNDGNGRQLTTS